MSKLLAHLFAATTLLAFAPLASAGDPKVEVQELVEKIKTKVKAGDRTEEKLAEELKGFDALLAAHKGEKTEDIAQIAALKAILYVEVFQNTEKGFAMLRQVKADFPETQAGQRAVAYVAQVQAQQAVEEAEKRDAEERNKKLLGTAVPEFHEKDLNGKELSVASRKGKVVLIDFWSTSCGPCVRELPNTLKTYEKFHDQGFEIIGICLDFEKEKLTSFLKEKNLPWPQYFDGQGWKTKIALQYGVERLPATFLLDKGGKILAVDLSGEALDSAVEKALAAK